MENLASLSPLNPGSSQSWAPSFRIVQWNDSVSPILGRLRRCRIRPTAGAEGAMVPETRYAKSGDVHIAFQVVGQGPFDLVHVIGWVSHLEYGWESPSLARFHNRLA